MVAVIAQAVAGDPDWINWVQLSGLGAVISALLAGLLVPKNVLSRVQDDRDRARAQRDELHRTVEAALREYNSTRIPVGPLNYDTTTKQLTLTDPYVPYDRDLYDIGMIEPVFVDEQTGFYTEKAVSTKPPVARYGVFNDTYAVYEDGPSYKTVKLDKPLPRYERKLKWRKT